MAGNRRKGGTPDGAQLMRQASNNNLGYRVHTPSIEIGKRLGAENAVNNYVEYIHPMTGLSNKLNVVGGIMIGCILTGLGQNTRNHLDALTNELAVLLDEIDKGNRRINQHNSDATEPHTDVSLAIELRRLVVDYLASKSDDSKAAVLLKQYAHEQRERLRSFIETKTPGPKTAEKTRRWHQYGNQYKVEPGHKNWAQPARNLYRYLLLRVENKNEKVDEIDMEIYAELQREVKTKFRQKNPFKERIPSRHSERRPQLTTDATIRFLRYS